MEACMNKCDSRKKIKLTKLMLKDCGWEYIHDVAYYHLKDALSAIVPLAHPKEDADVCVFTDASQDHRGVVITQVRPGVLSKPREEQKHEPLAFVSGSFKGASSRWPIVEKEAFVIVETCKRMEYFILHTKYSKENETSQKFKHNARYRRLNSILRRRNRESKGFNQNR
jgi:hypothetical protein